VSTVQALFNIVLVVMIVSTMFTAGPGITFSALMGTFRQVGLVLLVLVANLVLVPLIGWGAAALFSLATPAYIAMVLIASSPGAPSGAKLAMIQRGDVVAGSALQVLLATIGSVTFALTANWILKAANVGGGISRPPPQTGNPRSLYPRATTTSA
jgi:BASS family bile acid:Na+ symporter